MSGRRGERWRARQAVWERARSAIGGRGGEAAVACDVVARVTDQRGRRGIQVFEDLRASLEGQVAKLQEIMSEQVQSQTAKAVRTLAVRPLTSHSSRRAHELRWVTTACERHADPPLPGNVVRLLGSRAGVLTGSYADAVT